MIAVTTHSQTVSSGASLRTVIASVKWDEVWSTQNIKYFSLAFVESMSRNISTISLELD